MFLYWQSLELQKYDDWRGNYEHFSKCGWFTRMTRSYQWLEQIKDTHHTPHTTAPEIIKLLRFEGLIVPETSVLKITRKSNEDEVVLRLLIIEVGWSLVERLDIPSLVIEKCLSLSRLWKSEKSKVLRQLRDWFSRKQNVKAISVKNFQISWQISQR